MQPIWWGEGEPDMKTTLILLLSGLLALAALLTRPGRREFILYALDSQSANGNWSGDDYSRAQAMLQDVHFNDHWLWMDVEKDGKVIYTGAFAHWVSHSAPSTEKSMPELSQLAKLIGQGDSSKR